MFQYSEGAIINTVVPSLCVLLNSEANAYSTLKHIYDIIYLQSCNIYYFPYKVILYYLRIYEVVCHCKLHLSFAIKEQNINRSNHISESALYSSTFNIE